MDRLPTLSVIMPGYQAAGYLRITLPALTAALPAGAEFIFVDDCSSDDSAEVARAAGARVLRLEQTGGPSGARNAGAAIATGEVLVFIDSDIAVHPDALGAFQRYFAEHPEVDAVFGSYDDSPADTHLVSQFKNLMHHHVHHQGRGEAGTFWTGIGAIRRGVFEQVGPFRPVSIMCVEDIDYGHRLRDAGHSIRLEPAIRGTHLKRWTLAGLIRTDVMQRGIPWTVMMLRRGRADDQLNLGLGQRIAALCALGCVGLIVTAVVAAVMGKILAMEALLILALLAAGVVVLLNRNFYRLLVRRMGPLRAAACVPLHLLYYLYSLASLPLGYLVYLRSKGSPN